MVFKDIILTVAIEQIGADYFISIDKESYTPKELCAKYDLGMSLVRQHLRDDSIEEFTSWMQERLELKSLGITNKVRLFKREGFVCWSTCIADTIGCSTSSANDRLNLWEKGAGDIDTLFDPRPRANDQENKARIPNWGNLTGKKRDDNLQKLKHPGAWEIRQPEPTGFAPETGHCIGTCRGMSLLKGD